MSERPAPAIYRWVCPDGRSYVGSTGNHHVRKRPRVDRVNRLLRTAFKRYPPEKWTYEILEQLLPHCSRQQLRATEQQHIRRLRSWRPEFCFNINPATWTGDAGRKREYASDAARVSAWRLRKAEELARLREEVRRRDKRKAVSLKLVKALGFFGSSYRSERITAARMAMQILKEANLTWKDVLDIS
jgi:hypothetical protein